METALWEGLPSRLAQRRERRSREQGDDHQPPEPIEPPPLPDDARLLIPARRAGGVVAEMWEDPEMRTALARREVSTVYRLLRRRGVSQRQIAAMTGQSQSEVSAILNGRQVMAFDALLRIADGLGVPRGYMGLAYDAATAAKAAKSRDDLEAESSETVKRRKFLAHAAAVAIGADVLGVDSEPWLSVPASATAPDRVGMTDVRQVEGATRALRSLMHQYGSGFCHDAVVGQLLWARQLLGPPCNDIVRRRLSIALADLYNLAGWTSFEVGLIDSARNHFGRALELAKAGESDELVANILYRMGRVYLHEEAPDDALKMFQLGQIAAQQSGSELAVAVICANQAWAYAMMGHEEQTMKLIGQTREEFDRGEAADWTGFFAEDDLRSTIDTLHTVLAQRRHRAEESEDGDQ